MALSLSLTFHPLLSNAAADIAPSSKLISDSAYVAGLITRVNEIKDMDRSNLTATEKKDLRKELRSLKKEVRKNSNGIYLSVGAIIIIVLLLILIL
jgi:aromatic ring hydroxylase